MALRGGFGIYYNTNLNKPREEHFQHFILFYGGYLATTHRVAKFQ